MGVGVGVQTSRENNTVVPRRVTAVACHRDPHCKSIGPQNAKHTLYTQRACA